MATVNLGSIKFKWKGTYAGGTAYTIDDVVSYNGSSYICIQASTGNLPTDTAYFEQMSQAGTDGTDLTSTLTTQGDILYRDGSGLVRLAKGTANQVLAINSGATAPEWVDASGGKTLQVVQTLFNYGEEIANGNFSSTFRELNTSMETTFTPQKSTSKIMVSFQPHIFGHNNGSTTWDAINAQIRYRYSTSSPTSDTLIPQNKGDGYLGVIAPGDFSGLNGAHWIHHAINKTFLHDHDTPSGETITYTMYVKSNAPTASYDWRINERGTEDGPGRIILTELDI